MCEKIMLEDPNPTFAFALLHRRRHGSCAHKYEKVSIGKTQNASLCLHTMYNVCNSHYEKKGRHPRFGLHCHRSICLTFMYVFFSPLFTFEDVKIRKSLSPPPKKTALMQLNIERCLCSSRVMVCTCLVPFVASIMAPPFLASGLSIVSPCSIFGREDIGVANTPTRDCHKNS
jgi:hypothetical protein